MQPNPLAQSDKKRLRADATARRVVTLFGLMVLAMFVLLVGHILSNAVPLLNKPDLNFEYDFQVKNPDAQVENSDPQVENSHAIISIFTLSDTTMLLSRGVCEIHIQELNRSEREPIARFAHPCSSQLVSLADSEQSDAHYGLINSDGQLDLFALSDASAKMKTALIASFVIPEYAALVKENGGQPLYWHLDKYGQNLVLFTALKEAGYLSIWTSLDSNESVTSKVFDAAQHFIPLTRFGQSIIVDHNGVHLFNKHGDKLQTFFQGSVKDASVLLSPNQRSIYLGIEAEANETQVWRHANLEGTFTFLPTGTMSGLDNDSPIALKFDRQSLIAMAADKAGRVHIFNSATNEVVNTLKTEKNFERYPPLLHWYNNHLYTLSNDNLAVYSIDNKAGITTWKSLFSPVQYTGYAQAEYIWQTSQSAAFAEPKFSLVPLIIGSLKASLLALLVAIPLALGAAIYTAYFASNKIRNWVKPSIEMVEAIPSVIIGFVAAVWLAPFAERSLLALLSLLISAPLLVILLAFVHGLFTRTEMYHKIRKYYLALVSLAVVILIVVIFKSSMLLQVAAVANSDAWLSQFLAQFTITKTTVVVALALGIAVAPTIYSLVDDALFEVPEGVKQASFALGATELQTLTKVVLVVALPSIISAIMLGLGRAFGETMIVLMVTGNTPIADWDLFSGLRALTSNLTIELQESIVGTAHYHILFLTAAILFAFTFVINTIAALLKRRLQVGKHHV